MYNNCKNLKVIERALWGNSLVNERGIYFRKLDLVRILSCVLVLLYHINIVKGGFLAVCVFFSLTGYLSCMQAICKKEFSIKSYYINRVKKIYLPLLVVVFVTIIMTTIIPNATWINLKQETTSVVLGYNNFWQIKANIDYFTRSVDSPFMHLWYISILMQFELIFPIGFILLRKASKKLKHLSTIIVLILTVLTTGTLIYLSYNAEMSIVYYNTFARWFSIFFGILLAIINYKYRTRFLDSKSVFNSVFFIGYMALLIGLCVLIPEDSSKYFIFMIVATLIGTRLIEYSAIKSSENNKLDNAVSYIAKITYDVYLIHYPIFFFIQRISINDSVKLLLIITATILLSVVLHFLINHCFKKRIFNFIKYTLISLIILTGGIVLLTSVDYSLEMKELESLLNKNQALTEEKNMAFLNNLSGDIAESGEELIIKINSGDDVSIENEISGEKVSISEDDKERISEKVKNLPIVGIGDSVLLGCANELYKTFPNGYFDGKVSRTIRQAEDIINGLIEEGKLDGPLVLALANNGDYSNYRNDELMGIIGDREVYWINAVLADDPEFNDRFKEYAEDYPNIHIIDWVEESKDHEEYFYGDGIHLKSPGAKAYANMVYNAILDEYINKEYNN